MTEWFCHVTYLAKVFLLSFFSLKHDIFIIKSCFITHIKWDVIISSSLRLLLKVWIWYRCQNRIENYYHYDGEQLGFAKKVHIKSQSKKKDILVIIILQERKNCNLFNKNCTQERASNAIFIMKRTPPKLQVTPLSAYICWKKLCSHIFKASLEEVIVMHSEKMKAKYVKEDVWKSFFFVNLQVGIPQLHNRLTSSQIVFRYFK